MDKPNEIIVHCSDTRTDQRFTVNDIRSWHVDGNGWSDIGYHYYIDLEGVCHNGRSIYLNGAHCKGHNDTIGVCFEGGKLPNGEKWDKPNMKQLRAWGSLKANLEFTLGTKFIVSGHYEYSSKTCPNFDVKQLD